MVGTRNKSTRATTSPVGQHHHHHHRTGGYGVNNMSIVGRKLAIMNKCGQKHSLLSNEITCPGTGTDGTGSNNRHNVAIATQVINPSAIGGRRLVRPFEAEDDDESFGGSRRSKVNWSKIGCYGVSIIITVLVMTGVILAVGYMQSEKQRVLARSSKLAQDRNTTLAVLMSDDSPSFNASFDFESTEPASTTDFNGSTDEEIQIIEPSTQKEIESESDSDIHEVTESEFHTEPDESTQNNGEGIRDSNHNAEILHSPPAEVKVLPPKDFNFRGHDEGQGFSFDIPIYNASGKEETSFTFHVIPTTIAPTSVDFKPAVTILGNFTPSREDFFNSENEVHREDIPIVAKLQTDLFEAGSDSPEANYDDIETSPNSKQKGRSEGSENRGNPPKVKIPDRSYTPRPSSVNKYPERPRPPPPRPSYNKPSMKFKIKANVDEMNDNRDGGHGHVSVVPPPADFKFTPSHQVPAPAPVPSPPPPLDYAKFEFSNPNRIVQPATVSSGFENFKYDFTTPAAYGAAAAVTLRPTTVDLRFDFNNFATAHGLDLSGGKGGSASSALPIGNSIEVDYSQFTTPSTSVAASTPVNIDPIIDSQLLSPQPVSGTIGSVSPIGATLNYNYNFDASNNYGGYGGNTGQDSPGLAPGTIPLDLASSYIQAGPPGKIYGNNNNAGGGDSSQSFSYNDPTLALASLIQNQNSNAGSYGGGTPPPNYNTITQGIHLLSLLSGNIPNHLLTGQDQYASSSLQQNDYSSKPEYQIAALTGYGGSSNAFLSGLNDNAGSSGSGSSSSSYNPYLIPAASSQSYSADLYPVKTFPDQEGSFSQNIMSKLNLPGGKVEHNGRSGKSISSPGLLSGSQVGSIPKLPPSVEDHGPTLDVVGIRALLNKFIESGSTLTGKSQDLTSEISKSQSFQGNDPSPKDSNSARKSSDLDTAASEIKTLKFDPTGGSDSPEFGRKLILKTPSQKKRLEGGDENSRKEKSDKGLKSGFYI